jgi:hypothetical protein
VGVQARLCSHLQIAINCNAEMTGLSIRATVSQPDCATNPHWLSHVGQALYIPLDRRRQVPLSARVRNTHVSVAVESTPCNHNRFTTACRCRQDFPFLFRRLTSSLAVANQENAARNMEIKSLIYGLLVGKSGAELSLRMKLALSNATTRARTQRCRGLCAQYAHEGGPCASFAICRSFVDSRLALWLGPPDVGNRGELELNQSWIVFR